MAYETAVKVRFCETDALGHISNISYFIYLEEARTDFLLSWALVRIWKTGKSSWLPPNAIL